MIDWTNDKIAELITLLRGASVLLAIAIVALSYLKSRSLVTLLVAALTAGFFLWTINNTDWWQARVEDEEGAPAPVVVVADGPLYSRRAPPESPGLVIGGWRD
jgi:hypothetical protein